MLLKRLDKKLLTYYLLSFTEEDEESSNHARAVNFYLGSSVKLFATIFMNQ